MLESTCRSLPTLALRYGGRMMLVMLLLFVSACDQASVDGPRPQGMDKRYADRDGDMIADPPTASADFVSPDTIIFSYTPVEEPAVYEKVWADFLEHLAEQTGRDVKFYPVDSYAVQYEALRAGQLHVAGVNTGGVPIAVNQAGFVPFAMMAASDDSFGYQMLIIARKDSGIQQVQDIKGKRFALTEPGSNSGYRTPTVLLRDEFGITHDDVNLMLSGSHANSARGVLAGDYDAAAVASSVLKRMNDRGELDTDQLQVLYTSETFPTTAYGYAHNLDPQLAAKIREAFFNFDWEGTKLAAEFINEDPPKTKFVPVDYRKHWELVRKIKKALDQEDAKVAN